MQKKPKKWHLTLYGKVGIPDAERHFQSISFHILEGMRQSIVIAIALACRPDILICDEPTTA